MLSSSSFISGWRATDSISLPKMKPMPIPAPIEPSPAPTPSAIALPASLTGVRSVLLAWARGIRKSAIEQLLLGFSMCLGGRAAEVDGGERGEDERLKSGHQPELEDEEGEGHRERQRPERGEAQQHCQPAPHEQEQEVSGKDVGEQPHRERDQPHEVRDDLDHEDRGLAHWIHVLESGR